jgi:hypothetical protein
MKSIFNIFKTEGTVMETTNEELNKFLDGGFHSDRLYVIAGKSGQFKTGFLMNAMFQNPSEQVFMMGDLTDDEFNELHKSYYNGFTPNLHEYDYMPYTHKEPKELVEMLEQGCSMLILDHRYEGYGRNLHQKIESGVKILAELARDFHLPILYGMQINANAKAPEKLPSYDEAGYELIHVAMENRNGDNYLVLQKEDNKLELKFDGPYKVF